MAEAFIYDHVRTPRGRGKKDGALHEVSTPKLAAHVLEAIRDRNGLAFWAASIRSAKRVAILPALRCSSPAIPIRCPAFT